jgi:hypothetical protein
MSMKLDGSSRQLVAFLAASASAPYLTSLFLSLHLLTRHSITGFGDAIEFVAAILILGPAGLVIYGLPVAIAAGVLGGILIWIGFYHRIAAIIFGATLGDTFDLSLNMLSGSERSGGFWPYLISMTLSGAICGWIYWRIASSTPRYATSLVTSLSNDPHC